MANLKEVLGQNVREAAPELCEKLDRNRVRCFSCGHCCPIADGQAGVCKVRFNQGGTLQVPWGYVGGVQCDPIEKKPFFHAYSGALAYSFGMLGCDLHCSYCQNWVTSQALRDPHAVSAPLRVTPERLVREAVNQGARLVVSTLGSKSKIARIPYDQAYAPGFDDMRRRKPRVEKLERCVNFKPQTTLRDIIRLTAE